MIHSLIRLAGIQSKAIAVFLSLSLSGIVTVGAGMTIQYLFNTYRTTDHWVVYYSVEPTHDVFELGTQPTFQTKAIWHVNVDAAWYDRMWCRPDADIGTGADPVRINSPGFGRREERIPKTIGIRDDDGSIPKGGNAGIWQWDGRVPHREAECWLEPRMKIFPSQSVTRDVHIEPSKTFKFRRNVEGAP